MRLVAEFVEERLQISLELGEDLKHATYRRTVGINAARAVDVDVKAASSRTSVHAFVRGVLLVLVHPPRMLGLHPSPGRRGKHFVSPGRVSIEH